MFTYLFGRNSDVFEVPEKARLGPEWEPKGYGTRESTDSVNESICDKDMEGAKRKYAERGYVKIL